MSEVSYCVFCGKKFENLDAEFMHIMDEHEEEASHYEE